jgi:hypothetical protein
MILKSYTIITTSNKIDSIVNYVIVDQLESMNVGEEARGQTVINPIIK